MRYSSVMRASSGVILLAASLGAGITLMGSSIGGLILFPPILMVVAFGAFAWISYPRLAPAAVSGNASLILLKHLNSADRFQAVAKALPLGGMLSFGVGAMHVLENLDKPELIGPGFAYAMTGIAYGFLGSLGFRALSERTYDKALSEGAPDRDLPPVSDDLGAVGLAGFMSFALIFCVFVVLYSLNMEPTEKPSPIAQTEVAGVYRFAAADRMFELTLRADGSYLLRRGLVMDNDSSLLSHTYPQAKRAVLAETASGSYRLSGRKGGSVLHLNAYTATTCKRDGKGFRGETIDVSVQDQEVILDVSSRDLLFQYDKARLNKSPLVESSSLPSSLADEPDVKDLGDHVLVSGCVEHEWGMPRRVSFMPNGSRNEIIHELIER